MAGNYPDVPAYRFAYERDGTVANWRQDGFSPVDLTPTNLSALNDEDIADFYTISLFPSATAWLLTFIFPELRDVTGYWMMTNVSAGSGMFGTPVSIQGSTDTTNGVDGTWSGAVAPQVSSLLVPNQRTDIDSISLVGVKAIQFKWLTGPASNNSNPIYCTHLYGHIPLDQSIDRLVFWHPTLDQELPPAYLDWGNVPRGSTEDRTFRVKNLSATLTATDVVVSPDAPTDTTPSVAGQHVLSTDGVTFTGSIAVGDLPPGGISSVCTARRITPSDAALSLWTARLIADANSWS